MTPQGTVPDLPVGVLESPAEAWVGGGLLQGWGTECSSTCMGFFEGGHHYLHYLHHSLSEVKSLSRVRLFATPWTVAYQAPPSMGFSRQECWSGLPLPSPGDLPDPGIEPGLPALQADSLPSEPPSEVKSLSRVQLFVTPWTPGSSIHVIF